MSVTLVLTNDFFFFGKRKEHWNIISTTNKVNFPGLNTDQITSTTDDQFHYWYLCKYKPHSTMYS